MADSYSLFSTIIGNITPEEAAWFKRLLAGHSDGSDVEEQSIESWRKEFGFKENEGLDLDFWPDFQWEIHEAGDGCEEKTRHVWLYSMESGNPDNVSTAMRLFLAKFRPDECLYFSFANTCSKPRYDAFHGGGFFVTSTKEEYVDVWKILNDKATDFRVRGTYCGVGSCRHSKQSHAATGRCLICGCPEFRDQPKK